MATGPTRSRSAPEEASAAGNVEYRLGRKLFFLGLGLGLVANTDGGIFGYVEVPALPSDGCFLRCC